MIIIYNMYIYVYNFIRGVLDGFRMFWKYLFMEMSKG